MIFAETERLYLRALRRDELPRLVKLIGAWDVVRWLSVVPFPYFMKHAEEFYSDVVQAYEQCAPQFYTLALKSDDLLIGGIGLHAPRISNAEEGEIEIGYWLGKDFWGKGLMSEAALEAVKLGFVRPEVKMIGATTATNNHASQKILQKAGLRNLGEYPRDYAALRGDHTILRWLLKREQWKNL